MNKSKQTYIIISAFKIATLLEKLDITTITVYENYKVPSASIIVLRNVNVRVVEFHQIFTGQLNINYELVPRAPINSDGIYRTGSSAPLLYVIRLKTTVKE